MFWENHYKPPLFKIWAWQPANIPHFQTNISIFLSYSISTKDKIPPIKRFFFLSGQNFQYNWKLYNKKKKLPMDTRRRLSSNQRTKCKAPIKQELFHHKVPLRKASNLYSLWFFFPLLVFLFNFISFFGVWAP